MKKIHFIETIVCVLMLSCVSAQKTASYYAAAEALPYVKNSRDTQLKQTDIVPLILSHFENSERRPKALVINYDGCRIDLLPFLDAETSAVFSNASDGGFYLMFTGGEDGCLQNTRTAPGFTTQFTGKWALEEGGHGVFNNGLLKKDEPRTHFVRLAEKGYVTAFHFLWGAYRSIFANDRRYAEKNGLPVEWNRCRPKGEARKNPDEALMREVIDRLSVEGEGEVDFLTCIFENTDLAGHHYGFSPDEERYREALLEIDGYARKIIETVKNRSTYASEDWLILISTDHGGRNLTHGAQSVYERTIWISSNRPLQR